MLYSTGNRFIFVTELSLINKFKIEYALIFLLVGSGFVSRCAGLDPRQAYAY